jgi:hypothetical protein
MAQKQTMQTNGIEQEIQKYRHLIFNKSVKKHMLEKNTLFNKGGVRKTGYLHVKD